MFGRGKKESRWLDSAQPAPTSPTTVAARDSGGIPSGSGGIRRSPKHLTVKCGERRRLRWRLSNERNGAIAAALSAPNLWLPPALCPPRLLSWQQKRINLNAIVPTDRSSHHPSPGRGGGNIPPETQQICHSSGDPEKEVKYKVEAAVKKNRHFLICLLLCCSCSLPPSMLGPQRP